jgi:hypothetical protein
MTKEFQDSMASLQGTGYYRWMQSEGIPVVEGFSVEDVRALELGPWRRGNDRLWRTRRTI